MNLANKYLFTLLLMSLEHKVFLDTQTLILSKPKYLLEHEVIKHKLSMTAYSDLTLEFFKSRA